MEIREENAPRYVISASKRELEYLNEVVGALSSIDDEELGFSDVSEGVFRALADALED